MGTSTAMADESDDDIPHVTIPGSAESPEAVLRYLISVLHTAGYVPESQVESIIERLLKRESLGSTYIGRGIAMPHIREASLTTLLMIVGRLDSPIYWAETDAERVRSVYLVIASNMQDWVKCLEKVSSLMR